MQITNFEQPESNMRIMEVGKNKIFMRRTDPFGFIKLNYERGELPIELQGQFTSFDEAKKRIEVYLTQKGREAAEVENPPEQKVEIKKNTKNDSA
jgi:hypothetical protein